MRPFFILSFLATAVALADDAPPPVYSPAESQALFEFAEPGYRIELVASEPMVQDPVAIKFDGQGRLWVVEMRSYMQDVDGNGSKDPIGRISVLTDTNEDGVMDESTVFLDGLVLPRAIAVLPNGVLVAENKPLWFVTDTDGDLVADEKHLVDPNYARDNIEHSANGLYRAMDNWFYNAKEGHRYRRTGETWERDETESRGQWGICQDDRGRLFYNYNHSQLFTDLVPPNTFSRNPHHETTTGVNVSVVASNEVFPIRQTLATNRGYIPGALDQNGRIKQFTSACSPLIYRESLFEEFAGNAFVCETAGNLIKRNVLSQSGIQVSGSPAYADRDFLASRDERFRPCAIEAGPDGALYVVDMYRGIVQDAPHMSPYLREHSIKRKLASPIHLGRIWRIVPETFTQSEAPDFPAQSTDVLVALLEHPSGWWRDQAQTFLVESQRTEAIPTLVQLLTSSPNKLARLHALWTLHGLAVENPKILISAFDDTSPLIRSTALRVLPSLGLDTQTIVEVIGKIATTRASMDEVLQAILTLGELDLEANDSHSLLADLILPSANDPLLRDAALSSLNGQENAFLTFLWSRLPTSIEPGSGLPFLVESLTMAGLKHGKSESIEQLLTCLPTDSAKNWKTDAVLNGVRTMRNELIAEPIQLRNKPHCVASHPELSHYFAWPGHVPSPPVIPGVRPLNKKEQERFARGRQIYLTSCVACHAPDGMGTKYLAPPLAGSDWVTGDEERLVRVLLHGLAGPITVSGKSYTVPEIQSVMPPLAGLGNSEISAVLTYIRREWGNTADPVSSGRVNQIRIASQGRTVPWTEAELENLKAQKLSSHP